MSFDSNTDLSNAFSIFLHNSVLTPISDYLLTKGHICSVEELENVIKQSDDRTYFIFDTETTGLPKKIRNKDFHHPSSLNYYENSRIVEIAWLKVQKNKVMYGSDPYTIISDKTFLVKPEFFQIPVRATNIHGITTEMADTQGVTWNYLIEQLKQDIINTDVLVGHNVLFDFNVLLSELYRRNEKELIECVSKKDLFCTMEKGRIYSITGRKLTLRDLYYKITRESTQHMVLHRALNDVKMTYRCFSVLTQNVTNI